MLFKSELQLTDIFLKAKESSNMFSILVGGQKIKVWAYTVLKEIYHEYQQVGHGRMPFCFPP